MRRKGEYRQLANSVRKRVGDEEECDNEGAVGNFGGSLGASSRSIGKDPSAEEDR